ncbi:ABC transporter substrate-binding protein [Halobiforma nitratireducens]|uniref:ABC transporter periplasmic protein n=1 Tax=Halobiforma nitratireducens JCM 10879 TaxID=1227454 RepID=M0LKF1_9EURY|nr:ABC transporter periplasmic protein [Halobiforma nitratireducens JCM 10879]
MLTTAGLGVTIGTAGCVREVRNAVNRDGRDRLSLTITTLPADGDRESIQLARTVRDTLEAVGIDASLAILSHEEFLRAILTNHEFDAYVGRYPGGSDPAYLYETLHSQYADESGWQNPFGVTSLALDDVLERQRRADGQQRREAVEETVETFAAEQPFVPICAPDEYRLVRTDRFDGWGERHPGTAQGYLGLEMVGESSDEEGDGDGDGDRDRDGDEDKVARLRAAHTDPRPSQNLNPLSAEYRHRGLVTGLLYDSFAVDPDVIGPLEDGGNDGANTRQANDGNGGDDEADELTTGIDLHPWLAESWEWERNDDALVLSVRLRDDVRFHDGEPLTADDVEFTYRFLADTTLGADGIPAPSPRHRGAIAGLEAVEGSEDGHRVELRFDAGSGTAAAARALTVPILPKHVWRDRSTPADVTGVRIAEGTTDALVVDNVPAVGSGPFAFADRTDREHVTLERSDDHFSVRPGLDLPEPTVSEVQIAIDPRSTSAIELVAGDDADVTTTTLESYVIDDVLEIADGNDDLEVLESPPRTFYHLGFNARTAPFTNPRFRRTVARLIDKAWIVEDIFDGYATPVSSPVASEWVPDELAWDDDDPATPFLGTDGTGDIDIDAARSAFEAAGFDYDANGRLRTREGN